MNILKRLFKQNAYEEPDFGQQYYTKPAAVHEGIDITERQITRQSKTSKSATFLCIADTHGIILNERARLVCEISKKGLDAIITLGDVRQSELDIICAEAGNIPVFGVKGNHDDEDQFDGKNIKDLNGCVYTINNVSIIGIEGSIKYKPTAIGYTQEESLALVKTFPRDIDILFSHSHVWRDDDKYMGEYNVHIGLRGTRYYINNNDCVNIHGHDHISTQMINPREVRIYGIQRIRYYEGQLYVES